MKTINFHLNGEARAIEAWPDEPLIDVLRETFKIKSVKAGCGPQKECGCCLALIDGLPKVTCSVRIAQVQGRSILTLEGVSDNERRLYADAFQAAAGLQCGFCTPGLVLRIKWMTDQGRLLSRAEIARMLDGHLCRCTGYVKIIDAVELIQAAKRGGALPAVIEDGGVGERLNATRAANSRWARGPSSPTSTFPACSTALSCCRRMRAPGSYGSTPPKRSLFPASPRWRPPGMCRATAGSARFIRTGLASSPRAKRCATSATWWRPWPPRARASRARRQASSRSSTRR